MIVIKYCGTRLPDNSLKNQMKNILGPLNIAESTGTTILTLQRTGTFNSIQRGEWTKQQDLELLEKVEKEGKKWAKFGTEFQRT